MFYLGDDSMRPSQKDKIYDYLCRFYQKNGYPPSMGKIAAALGLSARSNINRQLLQLEEEGRLTHIGGKFYPAEVGRLANVVGINFMTSCSKILRNFTLFLEYISIEEYNLIGIFVNMGITACHISCSQCASRP